MLHESEEKNMNQHQSKYTKKSAKALIAAAVLASTVAPYSVQASMEITTVAQATTAINNLDPTKGMDYVNEVKAINFAVTTNKLSLSASVKLGLTYHTRAIAVVEGIFNLIASSGDINAITEKATLDGIIVSINNLKTNYSNLGTTSRGYVKNYATLTAFETTVKNRLSSIQNEVYLVDFKTAVSNLPTKTLDLATVKTGAAFTALPVEQKYSEEELAKIVDARAEYNKLTTTLRALISTELAKIVAHETQANYQKALVALVLTEKATAFTTKVTTLNTSTADYPAQVSALNSELAEISSQISSSTKLTLTYHTQAAAVVTAIKGLVSSVSLANIQASNQSELDSIKSNVTIVRNSYAQLGTTARLYVSNESELQKLESAITERQNYFNNASALEGWTTAYDAIKDIVPVDFTNVTGINFNDVSTTKYTSDNITNINQANTEYSNLSSTLKQLLAESQSTLLTQHVAAVARQAQLQTEADNLAAWIGAYGKIGSVGVIDFTNVTASTFTAAPKYTETQLTDIEEAKQQFSALSTTLQAVVPAVDVAKLRAHEAAAARQAQLQVEVDAAAQAQAAVDVEKATWTTKYGTLSAINGGAALPITSNTLLADYKLDSFVKYTPEQIILIREVRTLYTSLSAAARTQLAITLQQFQLLVNHETAVTQQARLENELVAEAQTANQTAATTFINKVEALTGVRDATAFATAVGELDFDKLDAAVKSLIPLATKNSLTNHKAVLPVVTAIAAITPIEEVNTIDEAGATAQSTLDSAKGTVTTARNLYAPLTLAQKGLVFNYANLTALETAITTKQAAITLEAAIKPFKDEFAKLPELTAVAAVDTLQWANTLTVDGIKADYYSDVKSVAITAAEQAYAVLTSTQKTSVATEYGTLTTHKGYYAKQQALIAEVQAYEAVKANITAFESSVTGLGTVKDFTGITTLIVADGEPAVDVYNSAQISTIEGLISTYTGFGDNTKFIASATKTPYEQHKAALATQKNLEITDQQGKVSALKIKIEGWSIASESDFAAFKIEIDTAKASYDLLTTEEKTLIGTANKTKLDNYAAAIVVIKAISELDQSYSEKTASADVTLFINTANAIKSNYTNLPSVQKLIVDTNYKTLLKYITEAEAKKKQLLITETLTAWNEAYDAIKGLTEHPLAEADFTYFDEDQLSLIGTAGTEYKKLNSMTDKDFVTAVDAAHLLKLQNLEAVVTKKKDIEAKTAPFKEAIKFLKGVTLIDYSSSTVADYARKGVYADFANFVAKIDDALVAYNLISDTPAYYLESIATEKTNLDKFKADVTKYALLKAQDENSAAIALALKPWTDLLGNLQAITLKGYKDTIKAENVGQTGFEPYTTGELNTISNARSAYNNLGTVAGIDVKTQVLPASYEDLHKLEADVEAYNNALEAKQLAEKDQVIAKLVSDIIALEVTAGTFVADVNAAQLKYMGMPVATKAEFNRDQAASATKLSNYLTISPVVSAFSLLESETQINATTTLAALNGIDEKVKAVRSSYDALTADQKVLYPDIALTALEGAIATQRTKLEEVAAIADWTSNYANLPGVINFEDKTYEDLGTLTLYSDSDISAVEALRNIYNAYTPEVKVLVDGDKLAQLVSVETAIATQKALQAEAAIAPQLVNWKAAFAKLLPAAKSFDTVKVENFETADKYTAEQIKNIKDAQTQYGSLGEAERAYVVEANKTLLDAHVVAVAAQEALQVSFDDKTAEQLLSNFKAALAAIDTTKETYITNYEALTAEYAEYKAKLTAEEKVSYANHGAAITVMKSITAAITANPLAPTTTVSEVDTVLNALNVVKGQYEILDETPKSYVTNYETLTNAISAAQLKKEEFAKNGSIATWTVKYATLPALLSFEGVTYQTIGTAITYVQSEMDIVSELRNIYDGYSEEVQGNVNETEYNNFLAIEKAVNRQKHLQLQAATANAQLSKLKAWNAAYGDLPAVIDTTGLTVANFIEANFSLYANIELKIQTAETEYSNLDADAKIFVEPTQLEKIEQLKVSVAKYLEVKSVVDELAEWAGVFNALPTLLATDSLTVENFDTFVGEYAVGAESKIQAARDVYAALSQVSKDNVNQSEYEMLNKLSSSVAKYREVKATIGKQVDSVAAKEIISAVTTMTVANIESAIELMEKYNELSSEAKTLISASQKLYLNYYYNSAQTVQLIKELPTLEKINAVTTIETLGPLQQKVEEARSKYASLGSTSRSYVSNIQDLIAAENAVKAKTQGIANESLLISWHKAITDLADIEVFDFTNVTAETYAEQYDITEKAKIIQARTEYSALSTTLRAVVSPTDGYIKLVALEAAVIKQTELEGQKSVADAESFTTKVYSLAGEEADFVAQVTDLNAQLSAVSPKLSASTKLRLTHLTQAVAVVEKINALSIAEDADPTAIAVYKAAVVDARSSYSMLGTTARSFVMYVSVLEENEAKAKTL